MPAEDPHLDNTTASEQPDWYFENGLLVYDPLPKTLVCPVGGRASRT